jgi:predicted nucleotidyltransferase
MMDDGVRQIVRVQHGSHLYGTNTPSSDMDYKGVHIPNGRAIILQRTIGRAAIIKLDDMRKARR